MTIPVGSYVQYNATVQDPRAPGPSIAEQTIGIVRQAFTSESKQYYQVVWNPGEMYPKSALYTEDQLCQLDQQTANGVLNQLAAGTYTPTSATAGSNFQQPQIPTIALPPQLQGGGTFSPTTGTNPPSLTETS